MYLPCLNKEDDDDDDDGDNEIVPNEFTLRLLALQIPVKLM